MKKQVNKFLLLAMLLTCTKAFAADKASVSGADSLEEGTKYHLTLHLSKEDASPLTKDDLQEVHKSKIHLLVIDDNMVDYQHIHPKAGEEPGLYTFSFTPQTAHNYTFWTDITPVKGPHEYLETHLQGAMPCKEHCIDKTPSFAGSAGELKGSISFDDFLKVGEETMGTLIITDEKGHPVKDLQPVMGAFAHIVGFYTDKPGVVHLHPMGKEPKDDDARDGPDLMFHISPEQTGVIKLFAQVRRDGKDFFIPFTLTVK
jgi:hypothetical protein